jgi:hypothetical protein
MKWYIERCNRPGLYYKGKFFNSIDLWTYNITSAKQFDTECEAKDFISDKFSVDLSNQCKSVPFSVGIKDTPEDAYDRAMRGI